MIATSFDSSDLPTDYIASVLNRVAVLWRDRITSGWTPPEGSTFPWEMVRVSLEGLFRERVSFSGRDEKDGQGHTPPFVAIICAGNTPLLAWPALCATLLAGATAHVKMSRHETLWPQLFVQSLLDAGAPELAARVHLYEWPGDDPRTAALVGSAAAVIAYGSDQSIAALRAQTPPQTPFFGFGHALSVGLWTWDAQRKASRDFDDWLPAIAAQARGFARDVLMYGQGGCLSPHTIFVETTSPEDVSCVCEILAASMSDAAEELNASPISDAAIARALREARDMAHFDGHFVYGDANNLHSGLVIGLRHEQEMPLPVGHGVVFVVPISDAHSLPEQFGQARGKISSVGVAGPIGDDTKALLQTEGVSHICQAGEMQAPPLNWPNGNIDLFTALPVALWQQKQNRPR